MTTKQFLQLAGRRPRKVFAAGDRQGQMAKVQKKSARPPLKGRDRLLLVAMQLFAERGFDGVTVRDIAKAADVSIGLINHHFESKEGLRAAVDAHFLEETSKAIVRASREAGMHGDLESVAEYHRTWIREYEAEWPSFAAYLRRAITENSEWGENLFREYYDSVSRMITRFDADGVSQTKRTGSGYLCSTHSCWLAHCCSTLTSAQCSANRPTIRKCGGASRRR